MSDDSDYQDYFDEEIDEKKYEKLVEDVLSLNKTQNVKKPSRTEPALQISEFNLVKSVTGNKGSVHLNELTKVLKGSKKHEIVSQRLKSTSNKSKTLPTPLEKPQAERIRRTVNYEKSRLKLDRWEALITSNRAAAQLNFPLDSVEKLKIEEKKAEAYPSTWRIKSDLQTKLEQLKPPVEEYHVDTPEKEEFPLTLEELKERRKEAAKLRAHQSFKEAKARQQNKIKSKKYHRILRREKIKQKLKEFEELQKTNPEEAMRKLEDIEKARAEERFSLRHKGTGQWAKSKQVRAKYDKESRQVLAQQLAISRDLTQKLKSVNSDSEDEDMKGEESAQAVVADENNPWVNGIKPSKDVTDFVSGYRKYWNEQNKNVINDQTIGVDEKNLGSIPNDSSIKDNTVVDKKQVLDTNKKRKIGHEKVKQQMGHKKAIAKVSMNDSIGTSDWEVSLINEDYNKGDIEDIFGQMEEKLEQKLKRKYDSIISDNSNINNKKSSKGKLSKKGKKKIDLTMVSKSKKHVIDEEMTEQPKRFDTETEFTNETLNADLTSLKSILSLTEDSNHKEHQDIDPNKFIQVKKTNLNTAIPDILTTDDNEENHHNQRDVILEAFEDDDIAEDFEKEKADEIEKDTPKDIDLNLPGWGSWGGANIDSSKRKRKRFIIKMPAKMPRRDDNKGSLIINEKAQSKIKPHMVSELPFPFKTIKDYEASVRAPIGNTFVTETAFKKLVQPAVTTKMGAIIEPMSKSVLTGKKKI